MDLLKALTSGDIKEIQKQMIYTAANQLLVDNTKKKLPLFVAIEDGNLKTVEFLLEAGAQTDVLSINSTGNYDTPLRMAVTMGKLDIVKLLMEKGAQPNYVGGHTITQPLVEATNNDHPEVAKYLFKMGADINPLTDVQFKSFMKGGEFMETASMLTRLFAYIKHRSFDAKTEFVSFILESIRDMNLTDPTGRTLLMMAAEFNFLNITKVLVQNGAKVNAMDDSGETALTYASRIGNMEILKYLIENGANTSKGGNDNSPLFEAVRRKDLAMIQYLIANGARFSVYPALLYAIEKSDLQIIKLLLSGSPDIVNFSQPGGHTPFMKAIELNRLELVKFFIENGAKLNSKMHFSAGTSPLQLCIDKEHSVILKLLLEHGAKPDMYEGMEEKLLTAAISNKDYLSLACLLGAGINFTKVVDDLQQLCQESNDFAVYIYNDMEIDLRSFSLSEGSHEEAV